MKRFLIFSDNHGINIYLKEVLDQIGTDFDGVVQLGDCQNAETEQEIRNIFTCPVYMVRPMIVAATKISTKIRGFIICD